MPVQDLLRKQIDQLGKLLNKILEDLLLPENNTPCSYTAAQESLRAKEPDLNEFMNWTPDEIARNWISKDTKTHENLEKLADIYAALAAREADMQQRTAYKLKALSLYDYITSETATFSFERNAKMQRLK
jgi:hypothetical protein